MNVLVFYTRLVLGLLFALFFIMDFRKGDNNSGWAGVASVVALWSSLVVFYFHRQKLLPLSSLKNNFNRLRQLAWTRAFLGFVFIVSGLGNIHDHKYTAGIGILSVGVFLSSPLGNWVFSYSKKPTLQETAMPGYWDRSMTKLAITRTLGLIFIMLSIGAYGINRYSFGHGLLITGVLLVFIHQVGMLFKRILPIHDLNQESGLFGNRVMNGLVFWSRLGFAFFLGLTSIMEFERGNTSTGFAIIATVILLIWPPLLLVFRGQSPSPLSSLKNNFDLYTLAAWLRAFVGALFAVGGFASLADAAFKGSVAILVLGWFLLLPVSSKVFSYGARVPGPSGRRHWGGRQTLLFVTRSLGLFFIVCGIVLYTNREVEDKEAVEMAVVACCLILTGLLFIFCRQIRMLFYGKQASMASPGYDYALPSDEEVFLEEPVQQGSSAPPATTATTTQGSGPSDNGLTKLSVKYHLLQQMSAANKLVVYREFLNELFSLYDFSAKNVFYIDGDEVNGTFEIEGQVYVLCARCGPDKCGHEALLVFNAKIEAKSTWARGIFINDAGFTQEGLATFGQGKRTSIICMDGDDLRLVLHSGLSLVDAIKRKARRAVETNRSFVPLHELV
jgi:hypothetical protein